MNPYQQSVDLWRKAYLRRSGTLAQGRRRNTYRSQPGEYFEQHVLFTLDMLWQAQEDYAREDARLQSTAN